MRRLLNSIDLHIVAFLLLASPMGVMLARRKHLSSYPLDLIWLVLLMAVTQVWIVSGTTDSHRQDRWRYLALNEIMLLGVVGLPLYTRLRV